MRTLISFNDWWGFFLDIFLKKLPRREENCHNRLLQSAFNKALQSRPCQFLCSMWGIANLCEIVFNIGKQPLRLRIRHQFEGIFFKSQHNCETGQMGLFLSNTPFVLFFHIIKKIECQHCYQIIRGKLINKMISQWLFRVVMLHIRCH